MSAVYRKPGTEVEVVANTRIINLGESIRITAIVGSGPNSLSVVDQAIQRNTGSVDYLPVYPATGVNVTKFSNVPKVPANQVLNISNAGNLFNISSASVDVNGQITWSDLNGQNVPPSGSVYYVSYTYDTPSTQYDPQTFSDKNLIVAAYGSESNTNGILSIAGSINLENGAPGVVICQASGSTVAGYTSAIDKLLKKINIEDLVIVFPSGSIWSNSDRNTVINYAISHLNSAGAIGRERCLIFGSQNNDYSPDGFDLIGDAATPSSYIYTATVALNEKITYVAPSTCTRKDAGGVAMKLDGNFIAAALAGKRAARLKKSTPLHGQNITGITIEDEKWTEFEMDQLGAGNCAVFESRAGIITIRDHITTDPTNADTQEPSVVDVKHLVIRSIRTGLNNTYTNKGVVITPTTTVSVMGTTAAILQTLITEGEIFKYGKGDDPITGETKITATQNAQEPRQIDVTCSFKPLYPLKWIKVTVSIFA